ncbi:hypothetical protein ABLT60_09980 [Acinetobacter ursingii]|uniref:hypothetical protein n=1 Tax=Acinetobacter ursingii TaxID=108980 RepID=UPI0032B365A1
MVNEISIDCKKRINFLVFLTALFSFGLIFNLLSFVLSNPIIRLWKEVLIVSIFLISIISLFLNRLNNKLRIYFLITFSIFLFIFYFTFNYFINDLQSTVYQFKQDIIPILLPISIYFIVRTQSEVEYFFSSFTKMIIIVAVLNSAFVLFESYNTDFFLSLIGVSDLYNTTGEDGIKFVSVDGAIRAVGLTTGFGAVASLNFISIVLLCEIKDLFKKYKLILILILTFSLYLTTYKTAILAIFFYFLFKLICVFIKSNIIRKIIFFIYTLFFSVFFIFIFLSYKFYNVFSNTAFGDLLYNSVYLRVYFHNLILNEYFENSKIYGIGFGVNGSGNYKDNIGSSSKIPLDSMFANILSNYGIIFNISYFLIFIFIFIFILSKKSNYIYSIACFSIYYIISFDYMANTFLYAYPFNVYSLILIMCGLIYRENRNKVI